MKSFIIILPVLAALAGGGWWYWNQSHSDDVKYQTVPITRGDVTQVVTATGQLNPVLNVTVGSQISGNILKLYADFNSQVKQNQIVAELDPAPYTASVHMADANVAYAKAALELAQLTANRKAELVKEHAAAQADLDTALANLHQAQATLQIQQASLETAQISLDHCSITSPVNGIVISRSVDVGQTVAASLNAPVLFTVANDLSKMQIDANVAEADVGQVQEKQTVNFTVDAYPYRTFHGTVKQVRNSPVTVQNVVTYDTVVAVNNDDLKLKPGMTANISVVIAQRNNVVKIPNAALRFRLPEATPKLVAVVPGTPPPGTQPAPVHGIKHDTSHTIYVLPEAATKPSPVPIHLGISDGIYTEVLDGLKEDDVVVTAILSANSAHTAAAPAGPGGVRRPF
jgi:HlyD family secretion protein